MKRQLLVAVALSLACNKGAPETPAPPAPSDPPAAVTAPAPAAHHSPRSTSELKTTDGKIAADNFASQLAARERLISLRPNEPLLLGGLIELLLVDGEYFGHLASYDRAQLLADKMVKALPKAADGYFGRATVLATFHRFADAEKDLDKALALGAKKSRVDGVRATIAEAQGRLDDADRLRPPPSPNDDLEALGAQAAALADRGRIPEAEQRFIEAQYHFADVSPFPVAWLYFHEGLMWERLGRMARARELYQAAHDRLPRYAPAASHLAGALAATGDRDAALALVKDLVANTDDPEYVAQLAQLEKDAGQGNADDVQRAAVSYTMLVANHPEAFADHAARFWLGVGQDPGKALALAEKNLALRKVPDAYALVLEAALAANVAPKHCAEADAAVTLGRMTPHQHVVAARSFEACGKADRAAAEMKAAAVDPATP